MATSNGKRFEGKVAVVTGGNSGIGLAAARGVRVNAVSPGPIETTIFDRMGMGAEQTAETKAGIASQVPLGRMGTAREAANAVLWLASDESSYVVGADLMVDGGMAQI